MRRRIIRDPHQRKKHLRMALLSASIVLLIAFASLLYYRSEVSNAKFQSQTQKFGNVFQSDTQSSKYITEFDINSNSEPNAITTDSVGNVWFTLGSEDSIAVLNPLNSTVHQYRLPESKNATLLSWGIAVDDSNGIVWFTDEISNSIWSFDTSRGSFMQYKLSHPGSGPFQIAIDPSGNVWFTETDAGGRLGEINTQGILSEYRVPLTSTYNLGTNSSGPAGITIGKDGTIWFAETYGNAVGSFTYGTFHTYPIQGLLSPTGIALDSFGNLWITQHGSSDITEFNPSTKYLRTISTSVIGITTSLPYFVRVDSQNNVWFNEHYGNAIAKFTPSSGSLVEYEIPTRIASIGNISGAVTMALGPNGHPWFTELYSGKIGTVNPDISTNFQTEPNVSVNNLVPVTQSTSASIRLSVISNVNDPIILKSYTADSVAGLSVTFSPSTGEGNFTSYVSIKSDSSQVGQGIFYVTLSAETQQLVVSQIIQVEA
jgi:virginiamycin B lyase